MQNTFYKWQQNNMGAGHVSQQPALNFQGINTDDPR